MNESACAAHVSLGGCRGRGQHKLPRELREHLVPSNRVRILWVIVTFDTLLKIAKLFSYAVVSRTHELLLAKSFSQELVRCQTWFSGLCRT
jgi:hypothetical protein